MSGISELEAISSLSAETKIPGRPRRRWRSRNPRALLLQIGVVAFGLGLWQVLSSTRLINVFFFSSPWLVLQQLAEFRNSVGSQGNNVPVWYDMWVTLEEALLGFLLGVVVGVAVGLLLGLWRTVALALEPLLNLLNTLPRVALGPLFILWFGIGVESKIYLVFTVVVFIMIFNTYAGTQAVDRELIATLRLLGAQRWSLITKLTLPSSLTWIFAGMRISLAWSLGAAVIGEYLGANAGVGYLIFSYSNSLNQTGLMAGCVLLLLMSFVLFALLRIVERLVLKVPASFG